MGQATRKLPVISLIEVIARLLTLGKVGKNLQSCFLDSNRAIWLFAPNRTIAKVESFELAHALFGSQIDPTRPNNIKQAFDNHILALCETKRGQLYR